MLLALVLAPLSGSWAAQNFTWIGGGATSWQTATNWTPNGVPGVDDTAIINSGVPILPGNGVPLPHIQLNNGVLGGQGTVTSGMTWTAGRIDGEVTIANGATLEINGTDTSHDLANGGTIHNSGTITWSGGYLWRLSSDASATSCSINNLADGVFQMTGNHNAYVLSARAWTFNNAGIVRKTGGSGVSRLEPTALNNSGTIDVQVGTLQLGGPGSASAGVFTVASGAALQWTSGAIQNGATFSGLGEQRVKGGTINGAVSFTNLVINGPVGGTSTITGTGQLAGGVITGNFDIAGSMDWGVGRVEGTLTIPSGSTLTISVADASHDLANGGTINNSGTTTWTNGYIWRLSSDTSVLPCTFNNLAGGVFEMTGNHNAYVLNSKPWTFNNAGTVRKKVGIGTSRLEPTAFNNTGVVEAQTGTLQVGGTNSVSPGSFMASSGAIIQWVSGAITEGASFSGAGEVKMNGGTLSGVVNSTNLILNGPVVGADATVHGTALLRTGPLSGTMTIAGSLDWQYGRMDGVLNISTGGVLLISGVNATHDFANGGTVNNAGTITWSNGYIWRLSTDAAVLSCGFNNLAGGLFEITGNSPAYVLSGKAWTFNNAGTLRKRVGTGTSRMEPTALNNTGLVEAETGTLQIGGSGSTSPGSFSAASGAIIQWTSGTITDGASFTGAGEVRMTGGTLTGNVTSTNLVINGAVGANATLAGSSQLRTGPLSGTLTVTGALDWQIGRVDGILNIAPSGSLLITGQDAGHELANGGTINNGGTATWSNGYLWRLSTDNSGLPCAFNNLEGGVFEISGNNQASLLNNKAWSFNNAGTVRKLSSGQTSIDITSFTNTAPTALVEVGAGVLKFGNFSQTAGTVWLKSGNIDCPNFQLQGGVMKGTRSLVGNVTQTGGELQPGDGIGTMTITGNLAQSGSGIVFVDIGGKAIGTQCDRLLVNGIATLTGGVSGTFVNGFAPRFGDEFNVIQFTSRSGTFGWPPFVAPLGRKMIPVVGSNEARLVTGLETMNLANWAEASGLTGLETLPDADPDYDGLNNRLEYGLSLLPYASEANGGPVPQIVGTPRRLQISYQRINEATDVDIEVQASSNTIDWQTIASSHHGSATVDVSGGSFSITEAPFPNHTKVTVVDQQTIDGSQPRRFLRVRVKDT